MKEWRTPTRRTDFRTFRPGTGGGGFYQSGSAGQGSSRLESFEAIQQGRGDRWGTAAFGSKGD